MKQLLLVLGLMWAQVSLAQTLQRVSTGSGYAEGTSVEGKRDGLWVFYNQKGEKISELSYKLGLANGWYVRFSPIGAVTIEGKFEDGLKQGMWCYFNRVTALVDSTHIYRKGILIKSF